MQTLKAELPFFSPLHAMHHTTHPSDLPVSEPRVCLTNNFEKCGYPVRSWTAGREWGETPSVLSCLSSLLISSSSTRSSSVLFQQFSSRSSSYLSQHWHGIERTALELSWEWMHGSFYRIIFQRVFVLVPVSIHISGESFPIRSENNMVHHAHGWHLFTIWHAMPSRRGLICFPFAIMAICAVAEMRFRFFRMN